MGYQTEFMGKVELVPGLSPEQVNTLREFSEKRHEDLEQRQRSYPGYWCDWVPDALGTAIVWNGGEKFYNYVDWMKVIISEFLKPWGIKASGTIRWRGDNFDDIGEIVVCNSSVTTRDFWTPKE